MHKTYISILLLLLIFGCEKNLNYATDLKPKYSDFENDREQRNLFGKVKQIGWYKITYQNDKKEGKRILNLKEEFTEFGSLKENSNYDNNGELIQSDVYEYDENDFLQKVVSTNKRAKISYVINVYHDTINKKRTRKVFVNDSLNQKITVFYNDKDFVIKQIAIEQNDTTIAKHEYKFNDVDKLVLERQIDIESNKPIITNEYSYDKNGNLNYFSYKTGWTELITETEWKNQRISKQTEYTIAADSKKHLGQITEFDRLYNQTNTKIYENSELNRELKYEYEFDEKGNWTKREVSMKEHFADSNEFKPIYSETREIKYWE